MSDAKSYEKLEQRKKEIEDETDSFSVALSHALFIWDNVEATSSIHRADKHIENNENSR